MVAADAVRVDPETRALVLSTLRSHASEIRHVPPDDPMVTISLTELIQCSDWIQGLVHGGGMPRASHSWRDDMRSIRDARPGEEFHIILSRQEEGAWPFLYEVLDVMSHDSGSGAGSPYYLLPMSLYSIAQLSTMDEALRGISSDDVETLAMGEISDARAVADRSPELTMVGDLLADAFNGFNPAEIGGADRGETS